MEHHGCVGADVESRTVASLNDIFGHLLLASVDNFLDKH